MRQMTYCCLFFFFSNLRIESSEGLKFIRASERLQVLEASRKICTNFKGSFMHIVVRDDKITST